MRKRKIQFIIQNENQIKKYSFVEKHIVISITSPGYEHPKLPTLKSRVGLLQIKFHDIDKTIVSKGKTYPVFTKEQAKIIMTFFNYHKSKINSIVCQCELGASRSPAVAAALAKGIGQDDSKFFKYYCPNMYVYRLLLNTIKGI